MEGENVTGYRYIIHLYCLAVQAGFYSDVVECSPQDRKVPGSILDRGMKDFLRVRDIGLIYFFMSVVHIHAHGCAEQNRKEVVPQPGFNES